MKTFVKEHMVLLAVSAVFMLVIIYALFRKYDYEVLGTNYLDSAWGSVGGGQYLEGDYVDAVLKIKGSVFGGEIRCFYFNSDTQAEWENPEDLILVDRTYGAGEDVDEEIYIGALSKDKWQYLGLERVGEEDLKQNIEITLEARQYGYQIVAEFLKLKTPFHS